MGYLALNRCKDAAVDFDSDFASVTREVQIVVVMPEISSKSISPSFHGYTLVANNDERDLQQAAQILTRLLHSPLDDLSIPEEARAETFSAVSLGLALFKRQKSWHFCHTDTAVAQLLTSRVMTREALESEIQEWKATLSVWSEDSLNEDVCNCARHIIQPTQFSDESSYESPECPNDTFIGNALYALALSEGIVKDWVLESFERGDNPQLTQFLIETAKVRDFILGIRHRSYEYLSEGEALEREIKIAKQVAAIFTRRGDGSQFISELSAQFNIFKASIDSSNLMVSVVLELDKSFKLHDLPISGVPALLRRIYRLTSNTIDVSDLEKSMTEKSPRKSNVAFLEALILDQELTLSIRSRALELFSRLAHQDTLNRVCLQVLVHFAPEYQELLKEDRRGEFKRFFERCATLFDIQSSTFEQEFKFRCAQFLAYPIDPVSKILIDLDRNRAGKFFYSLCVSHLLREGGEIAPIKVHCSFEFAFRNYVKSVGLSETENIVALFDISQGSDSATYEATRGIVNILEKFMGVIFAADTSENKADCKKIMELIFNERDRYDPSFVVLSHYLRRCPQEHRMFFFERVFSELTDFKTALTALHPEDLTETSRDKGFKKAAEWAVKQFGLIKMLDWALTPAEDLKQENAARVIATFDERDWQILATYEPLRGVLQRIKALTVSR